MHYIYHITEPLSDEEIARMTPAVVSEQVHVHFLLAGTALSLVDDDRGVIYHVSRDDVQVVALTEQA